MRVASGPHEPLARAGHLPVRGVGRVVAVVTLFGGERVITRADQDVADPGHSNTSFRTLMLIAGGLCELNGVSHRLAL